MLAILPSIFDFRSKDSNPESTIAHSSPQELPKTVDRSEDGFSVLEALIAMALLSAAFLPLLQIQAQFVRSSESLELAQERLSHAQIIDSFFPTLNLDSHPEGSEQFGLTTLTWSASRSVEAKAVRGYDGIPTRFTASLYDATIYMETPWTRSQGLPPYRYTRFSYGWTARHSALDDL